MSLLNIFRSKPAELVCPRCEKPLSEHDETACSRRMSRRFFFQAVGGAAVAAAVAPVVAWDMADCAGVTIIEEWRKQNGIVTRRILSESRILLDEAVWPGRNIPAVLFQGLYPTPDMEWITLKRTI